MYLLNFRCRRIKAIILINHLIVRMVTDFHKIFRYGDIKHSIKVMFKSSLYCLL